MKVLVDRLLLTLVAILLLESPSPAPIMPPALDDRSYRELVAETVARIPAHTPEWTNFNEGDPGFRLLDFFRFLDEPVLESLLVEDHQRPFWSTLPFEGEEYRGQFAYTWLDAALTMAEDPATPRSPSWLTDHGINPDWTFDELISIANVPEPASALLLAWGLVLIARRFKM